MDNQAANNDKENVNPEDIQKDIDAPKVYTVESKK
jgi:hypothetical protein